MLFRDKRLYLFRFPEGEKKNKKQNKPQSFLKYAFC